MSPPRVDRWKDPIGTSVFYPDNNTAPIPPLASPNRSPLLLSRRTSISIPAPPFGRTLVGPRGGLTHQNMSPRPSSRSGAIAMGSVPEDGPPVPHHDAVEYPFPNTYSPPTVLSNMLESFNLFTPGELSRDRGSAADLSILSPPSPEPLSLRELIHENLIHNSETDSPITLRVKSPLPQHMTIPFPEIRDQRPLPDPIRTWNGPDFFLGFSPGSPGYHRPPPIPVRQPAWSSSALNTSTRRASSPSVSTGTNLNTSNLASPHPPLRTDTPSPNPELPSYNIPNQPKITDIFSPTYSLASQFPSPPHTHVFIPETNSLNLSFTYPSHPHTQTFNADPEEPEAPTSEIAERHLKDRVLNPDFLQRYELRDELGSGGFGFVVSAVQTGWGNVQGVEVAVKFIFKERVGKLEYGIIDGEPVESFVLARCQHVGVIGFLELYEDPEFFYLVQELHGDPWQPGHTLEPPPSQAVTLPNQSTSAAAQRYIASPSSVSSSPVSVFASPLSCTSELYPHNTSTPSPSAERRASAPTGSRPRMGRRASHDLFEAVEHSRFTEDQARYIFKQIVDAVGYLHGRGIYHRDLKDENIVIDRNLQVKIIDFGSAVIENPDYPSPYRQTFRGTMSYAPPECQRKERHQAGPADIWALGIILGILINGETPFPTSEYAQMGQIRLSRTISAGAWDILNGCCHVEPRRRWGIEQVRAHWWFDQGKRGSL